MRADHLLPRGERVLVAVSGGADSVALLHALAALQTPLGLRLRAVHVDHQLRPDSAQDAEFVRQLGQRLRVPVTVAARDVQARCRAAGWSLEEGARRVRYEVFLEEARRHSAGAVALAHTADDQAETVLWRLVRGCGLAGLAGMPVQRALAAGVRLVRPFLGMSREEVRTAVREAGWAFREDPSNSDPRFVRNRIRRELIPLLERSYNPNLASALTQLAMISRDDAAWLARAAGRAWKRVAKRLGPKQVAVRIAAWRRQPAALQRQIARRALEEIGADLGTAEFRHWLAVERLFGDQPAGAVVDLPGGVRWRRERDQVVCEPAPAARVGPGLAPTP